MFYSLLDRGKKNIFTSKNQGADLIVGLEQRNR